MKSLRLLLAFAIAFLTSSLTSSAHAQAKSWNDGPGFYLYGAPVFFAVPLGDDDVDEIVDFSYQWGLGLGGMIPVTDTFGIGIGFGFEHNPATLDDDIADPCDLFDRRCELHAFRMLAEARLGGMIDQLFAYGYVAPGLGITYAVFENPGPGDDDDADAGFNMGFGGGVQYLVWKGLFVGGELGFDLGIYHNDEVDFGDDDYGVYLMDLKGIVGYLF